MIGRMSIRTKCRKKLSQPRGRNPCQRLYQRCLLLKRPPSPNWSPQRIQPWRTLKFQVKKGSKPTAKAPIRWSLWLWQALLRRAQHPSILLFRRPIPYLLCMSIVKKVSKVKKRNNPCRLMTILYSNICFSQVSRSCFRLRLWKCFGDVAEKQSHLQKNRIHHEAGGGRENLLRIGQYQESCQDGCCYRSLEYHSVRNDVKKLKKTTDSLLVSVRIIIIIVVILIISAAVSR